MINPNQTYLQILPVVRTIKNDIINLLKVISLQALIDGIHDLLPAGPDIPEVDRVPVRTVVNRILNQVDIHPANECIDDYQHGGHQVVHLHLWLDPRLEIPVSREHDATTRSPLSTASAIWGGSGPEFPMQEVQPYPTL